MTNIKRFLLIIALLSLVVIVIVRLLKPTTQPQTNINYEIKKQSDSIAIVSLSQSDSTKLRKLEKLKRRIAEARYNDSLQRAKNK